MLEQSLPYHGIMGSSAVTAFLTAATLVPLCYAEAYLGTRGHLAHAYKAKGDDDATVTPVRLLGEPL